jgi:hypothetical protein
MMGREEYLELHYMAIQQGYVYVLEWLEEHNMRDQEWSYVHRAIECNQLGILKFLLCHGIPAHSEDLPRILSRAERYDDWRMHDWFVKWLLLRNKWPVSFEYITKAARHGLHRLKHMHSLGIPLCSSLYAEGQCAHAQVVVQGRMSLECKHLRAGQEEAQRCD